MPKPHPADALSREVLDYVESMSDYLARSLHDGPLAPPTQPLTQAEKIRYFSSRVWNPDGTPNQQGRDALVQQYGWRGFSDVLTHLGTRHGQLTRDARGALPEPIGGVPSPGEAS